MMKNLKIIEISSVLAGPSVGMFFAELGSEVIKIENKLSNGDITRKWHQTMEDSDKQSAYFSSANWGKKHIFLDFNNSSDKKKLIKLVKAADILITNFKHGDAEKFNLTFKFCKSINQKIIYAKIEGFKTNPHRVAFDAIIQAETGFMSINGESGEQGVKMPVAMMDILAAHQLKEGILIALLKRKENSKAYCVSTTLEETGYASLANQASNYLMTNVVPRKMGSLHPNIAPYGEKVITKDKESFLLAIGTDKQFLKFSSYIGLSEKSMSEYKNNKKRVLNRKNLIKKIQKRVSQISAIEFSSNCIKLNIPIGKINTIENAFKSTAAQNMILKENVNGQITKRVASIAFKITN
ncbi:MAG: CaiB/BaiF CoA-transferase family protein [Flavobacteriales bacterium]|nr:CaiB/BaiF CoA-transferase family protein [Flavobacteriales bacterium]